MRHRLFCIGCVLAPLCLAFFPEVYGQSWKSLNDTAIYYNSKHDAAATQRYYRLAVASLGDSLRTVAGVRIVRSCAISFYGSGNLDSALTYFGLERKVLEDLVGKADSNYATNAMRIGACYGRMHQNSLAINYFREAKAVRSGIWGKESVPYADACFSLANAEYSSNDLDVAERDFLEARQILEDKGQRISASYASCCNGLCRLYLQRGDYERAEPLALSTLEVRGEVFHHSGQPYAISLSTLAELYIDLDQYEKAEPLLIRAKQIYDSVFGRLSGGYVGSCVDLAKLYDRMKRLKEAETLYLEAKQVLGGGAIDRASYAMVCNNLANLYIQMHEWQESKSNEEEAGAIWESLPPDDPNHAIHWNTLGTAELGIGDYEASLTSLKRAEALWSKKLGKDHPFVVNNVRYQALVYWRLGQLDRAKALYIASLQGKIGEAKRIFQFTSEREKTQWLETEQGVEEQLFTLLWSSGDQDAAAIGSVYDIVLAHRNMVLTASRHVRDIVNKSGDARLMDLYRRWIDARRLMADDSADRLEKELTRGSESLTSLFAEKAPDWKLVQGSLSQDQAAVEYISFRFYDGVDYRDSILYAARVLRKDRPGPVLVPLCGQNGLDSLLRASGQAGVTARGAGTMSVAGGDYSVRLYRMIWAPLEKELAGARTVFYAPTGALYRVSFAAIKVSGDSVLSDRFHLEQMSQTDDLTRAYGMRIRSGDRICAYGGVDYGSGTTVWPSLPGTVTETDAISRDGKAKGVDVTVRRGMAATEASVKSLDGQPFPVVLHLASHGFCFARQDTSLADAAPGSAFMKSRDPLMRSGIVLAGGNLGWSQKPGESENDGILTSYEISNLYLPSVRLVVLSACETALGEIQGTEGVYGLARAFRMAGVSNLVMSLWAVPDQPTAEFMSIFYQHLFNGETANLSFEAAQTAMKTKYRKQPEKWAAWILVQ